jgi:hypothetical protein
LSDQTGDAIVEHYWAYAAGLFRKVDAARRSGDWHAFEREYLTPFWTFLVRKR